jgi:hypothetical protein
MDDLYHLLLKGELKHWTSMHIHKLIDSMLLYIPPEKVYFLCENIAINGESLENLGYRPLSKVGWMRMSLLFDFLLYLP